MSWKLIQTEVSYSQLSGVASWQRQLIWRVLTFIPNKTDKNTLIQRALATNMAVSACYASMVFLGKLHCIAFSHTSQCQCTLDTCAHKYRSVRFWTHLHIFLSVHNLELLRTLVMQQGVHERGAHRLAGTKVDTTTIHCLITVQHQPQTQQITTTTNTVLSLRCFQHHIQK